MFIVSIPSYTRYNLLVTLSCATVLTFVFRNVTYFQLTLFLFNFTTLYYLFNGLKNENIIACSATRTNHFGCRLTKNIRTVIWWSGFEIDISVTRLNMGGGGSLRCLYSRISVHYSTADYNCTEINQTIRQKVLRKTNCFLSFNRTRTS
jgi:hypothetical protein